MNENDTAEAIKPPPVKQWIGTGDDIPPAADQAGEPDEDTCDTWISER